MSTRAAIGRILGDGFEGRYVHSDGYPTWLGQHFRDRALRAPDLEAFIRYVVNEHTAGFSTFGAYVDACYCHTYDDREGDDPITECDLFIEWAYAIDPETRRMGVWASVEDPTRDRVLEPAAGRQYVEPGYRGVLVAAFGIDDDVDWQAIQERGDELKEEAHNRADLVTVRLYHRLVVTR